MATISLRAYLAELEELLNTNTTDEVIHHCRHILQYFPKNITAYSLLGRALLYNTRWDEAAAVLRRVLGVFPDNYFAHIGMSEFYEQKGRGNDAIWHLERAFEHDPNNSELNTKLRELYLRYRQIDQGKIQLTAAAVARQYARNRLYDQAIDALRGTLERMPERMDLRLLLARTLWDSGQLVEGAEAALDVLQQLPDCLDANRIMTELWLSQGRPSDAQRYLHRIEAVDPYIALELVQDEPVQDSAFTLEQLDYQRFARSALATNRLDWLQELGGETSAPASSFADAGEQDWSSVFGPAKSPNAPAEPPKTELPTDWAASMPTVASPAASSSVSEFKSLFSDLPDDWGTDSPAPTAQKPTSDFPSAESLVADLPSDWFGGDSAPAVPAAPAASDSLFDDLPDWLDAGTPAQQTPTAPAPDMSELFGEFDEPPAAETSASADDFPDWLQAAAPQQSPAPSPQPAADLSDLFGDFDEPPAAETSADDFADWLQAAAPQQSPAPSPQPARDLSDLFGDFDEPPAAADAPALADEVPDWLQAAAPAEQPAPTMRGTRTDNPLEWAKDSGIEIIEDAQRARPQTVDDAEMGELTDPAADPLAWMKDYGDSIVMATGEHDAVQPAAVDESSPDEADPFAWMKDSGIELVEEAQHPAAPAPVGSSDDDAFDWLSNEDLAPELMDIDQLAESEAASASLEPTLAEEVSDEDFFFAFEDSESTGDSASPYAWTADRQSAMSDKDAPQFPEPESMDDFEWLTDEGDEASEPPPASSTPEWLNEMSAASAQPSSDMPSWAAEITPAASGEMPDWLTDLAPDETMPDATNPVSSTPDDQPIDMPSWAVEITPAAPGEMPDWLTDLEPEAPKAEAEPAPAAGVPGDDFEWMTDIDTEDAEAQPAAVSEMPDWLGEMQPLAEEEEIESVPAVSAQADDSGFDWLDADEDEIEAQIPAAPEMHDWLADMKLEDNLADAGDEESVPAASEMPDWLTDMQPEDEEEAPVPAVSMQADDDGFDWLTADEDEVEAQIPAASEVPSWLADLQQEEPAPEPEAEPAQPAATLDMHDWFSSLEPETADALTPGAASAQAAEEGFDWLEDIQDEEEAEEAPEPATAGGADWLGDIMESHAEVPTAADTEQQGDTFGWLDDIDEDLVPPAVPEHAMNIVPPASNAPDWLNAMVPGLDLDYEARDEMEEETTQAKPVAEPAGTAGDFSWVTDIAEKETTPAAPRAPRFSFTHPPAWLRRRGEAKAPPAAEPTKPAENATHDDDTDFELPDWLK